MLKDKIAVVTGGSGVLGSNVSEGLLKAGVHVAIIGAHQHKVDDTLQRLRPVAEAHGAQLTGYVCNVLEPAEIDSVRDQVLAQYGRVDILVNAAGGNVPGATIMDDQHVFDMKREDLQRVIDLNLYGTIYPCLAFGRVMAEQKEGNIINVSSMAAYDSLTRVMGYAIAKEGVIALTKWLAQEMAIKYSEKIRVNAIAPGFMLTDQNRYLLTDKETGELTPRGKSILTHTPMARFGTDDDLYGAAVWLLSPAAEFVTGITVPIDGGFAAFSGV